MSEFPKHYSQALRYSADHSSVPHLLSPESLTDADRWGGKHADHTKRGVIADYLQDLGRDSEAGLLRSGRHVLIENNEVKPGRWTLEPINEHRRRVRQALLDSGWEAAHPGPPNASYSDPNSALPSASFTARRRYDEFLDHDVKAAEPHRHHYDEETGLPMVDGSTFTCHDFECPVSKAATEWTQLMTDTLFHPGNQTVQYLPLAEQQRLERLAEQGHHLKLEEVDPTYKEAE